MSSVNILIVENVSATAIDLQMRLERLGYVVAGIANSGEDAIKKTAELNPDLILMNIKLRRAKDGIQTGELIYSSHRKPIIYIAPSASQGTIRRAGSAGSFGYVFPGMDDRQMFATIETAIVHNELELNLDNSRKWLSGILNSIGDGVIAMDGRGQIQFINFVAQELTGWSQSEASDKSIYEVCRFVDEKTLELIDLARTENAAEATVRGSNKTALLISKAGKATPVEANVNLLKNKKGTIIGIVLAFRDVTQHRENLKEIETEAQRAKILEQSASRLNTDLDTKSMLTSICNITNSALHAHASCVFLYENDGESECEIVMGSGQEPRNAISAESLKAQRSAIESLISSENPIHVEEDISGAGYLPHARLLRDDKIKSLVIAGIFRQEQLIGVLLSLFPESRQPLQDADLKVLGGLLDQAATALTNASLFRQVKIGRERHRKLAKSLIDVQEAERRRIAAELHDHLGQLLTGLQFMLETVKSQADAALKPSLDDIQGSVSDIIEQVREMSLNLRPSMLDDMGLIPTLKWHFGRFTMQTGILVNFQCDEIINRSHVEVETAAYRIVQEALTNVARYAQVKSVFVGLAIQQGTLWVEVVDKGRGFDASAILERPTSGLGGMRERAELSGGYLVVRSILDQGTQIIAALPIHENRLERRKHARKGSIG